MARRNFEQPPQPEGQKTLMERVREMVAEAGPAVIAAAVGGALAYIGGEVLRQSALQEITAYALAHPDVADAMMGVMGAVAEKTKDLPPLFAALAGGYGMMAASALGRREKGPAAEQEQAARVE